MRYLNTLFFAALIAMVSPGLARTQVTGEGVRGYGQTGESASYDTTARETIRERAGESAGLMERPIDPQTYQVGPNDVIAVTIWSTKSQQYAVTVTPDAKLLIPTVGEVDVRGLTLAETTVRVKQVVSSSYRARSSVSLKRMREFKVNVIGAVRYHGAITASPTTRVAEAIQLAGGALQRGDQRNIQIIRYDAAGAREILSVDLLPFLTNGELTANPYLLDGDVVRVGILDPSRVVRIYGEVVQPGEYSWHPGDSVASMLAAGFGPTVDARLDSIEVVSFDDQGFVTSRTYHTLDTATGRVLGDRALSAGDRILVRRRTNLVPGSQVVIRGEVNQPGVYVVDPGRTRLSDIFASARGVTERGNLEDALLIRRRSQGRTDEYFVYVASIDGEKRSPAEQEYYRTKLIEGRRQGAMTVNFRAALSGDSRENIVLQDDDSIWVPARVEYVRLSGKVKSPGNQLYRPEFTFRDYIAEAGGYSWKADESETQVIKSRTGDRLSAEEEEEYRIEPGDAIFVPEEQESTFWTDAATALTIVTQVMAIVIVVTDVTSRSNPN